MQYKVKIQPLQKNFIRRCSKYAFLSLHIGKKLFVIFMDDRYSKSFTTRPILRQSKVFEDPSLKYDSFWNRPNFMDQIRYKSFQYNY